MLLHPSFQVLAQRLSGDSQSVSVDQLVLEQVMQDRWTSNE